MVHPGPDEDLQENLSDRTNKPVTRDVRFLDTDQAWAVSESQSGDALLAWLREWLTLWTALASQISALSSPTPVPGHPS